MSRILLTTFGSLGDLHPFLALGLGLRDRGHEIIIATIRDYRQHVESIGLQFQPIRPDDIALDDAEMTARLMDLKKGPERLVRDYIFANLRNTYQDLLAVATDIDFIVSAELTYAARLVAEIRGIPWAFCALSPISFLSAHDPSVLPILPELAKCRSLGLPFHRGLIWLAQQMTRSWGEPMHQLRRELGLPPIGHPMFAGKFSPHLVLAMFSSVLAQAQPDWPEHTEIVGFPFYTDNGDRSSLLALQQFLDAGSPPIVFTLGSAAVLAPGNFYRESAIASQQLGRRAVLLIGKNPPPADLPEGIAAVDYAPYGEVFPRACAIVHQGGIGTTAQALRSGQPTVVVPYSHDQPDCAARLERLGTSLTISRSQYTAKLAISALSEILDRPSYQQRANEVGTIIRSENGISTACQAISRLLNDPTNRAKI